MKIFFKEKPRSAQRVKRRDGLWQKLFGRFRKSKPQTATAKAIPEAKIIFKPQENKKPAIKNRTINWGRIRNLGLALLAILVIAGIGYGIKLLTNLPALQVTQFTVLGNRSISNEKLQQVFDKFRGVNILTLNQNQIDKQLHDSFNVVKDIQIRKIYPNRLFVVITEREPKLIVININGAYLVDNNAQVLQILKSQQLIFSDERLQIAQGLGDPNSPLVEERLRAEFITKNGVDKLSPDDQQKAIAGGFDFTKINLGDKQKALDSIENEAVSEIEKIIGEYAAGIQSPDYSGLPIVYAYENKNYKINDDVDKNRLDLTNEVIAFLNDQQNQLIKKIVWEGQILAKFDTNDGKSYIFGTNRDTTNQLEDLILVQQELLKQKKNYSRIDVSSEKISVI
jgi:cell division septal protein FtsQ